MTIRAKLQSTGSARHGSQNDRRSSDSIQAVLTGDLDGGGTHRQPGASDLERRARLASRGLLRDEDFRLSIDRLVRDGQIAPDQEKPSDIYTNQYQPEPLGER